MRCGGRGWPLRARTWRALPYTDDPAPWRRLACAMLLGGVLGAYKRDGNDIDWIAGDESRRLAEMVGLPTWPPRWGALASRAELQRRANDFTLDVDDAQSLSSKRRARYWTRKAKQEADQLVR